ncbi:MAG TPA: hypothetical protein PLD62_06230, partial [Candidatus Cloacimonadota bacterium]|nr:hypothetical protein [Candidatus Cloacimonadota bacterium]
QDNLKKNPLFELNSVKGSLRIRIKYRHSEEFFIESDEECNKISFIEVSYTPHPESFRDTPKPKVYKP